MDKNMFGTVEKIEDYTLKRLAFINWPQEPNYLDRFTLQYLVVEE